LLEFNLNCLYKTTVIIAAYLYHLLSVSLCCVDSVTRCSVSEGGGERGEEGRGLRRGEERRVEGEYIRAHGFGQKPKADWVTLV
jgi:hypothetical protein